MTRRTFVRAAVAVSGPGLSALPQFRGADPQFQRVPKGGSLFIATANSSNIGRVRVRHLDLDPVSWTDLKAVYEPLFLYSRDRKALYVSYSDTAQLPQRHYLDVIDFTGTRPPSTHPLGWDGNTRNFHSLQLSVEGRWLCMMEDRIHPAQMSPPARGEVVNDLDASYGETLAYIFDLDNMRFASQAPLLVHSCGPEEICFEPHADHEKRVRRVSRRKPDRISNSASVSPNKIRIREAVWSSPEVTPIMSEQDHSDAYWAFRARAVIGGPTYVIEPAGVVWVWGDRSRRFSVDAVPAGRVLGRPALSGDGRFIFVPTHKNENDVRRLVNGGGRVTVYRTEGFIKVRELESPTALLEIYSNGDGSILYDAGFRSHMSVDGMLRVLDAQSLRVMQMVSLKGEPIERIYPVM